MIMPRLWQTTTKNLSKKCKVLSHWLVFVQLFVACTRLPFLGSCRAMKGRKLTKRKKVQYQKLKLIASRVFDFLKELTCMTLVT